MAAVRGGTSKDGVTAFALVRLADISLVICRHSFLFTSSVSFAGSIGKILAFDKLSSLPHVLDAVFESVRRQFDAASVEASARVVKTLNEVFRRFRTYETESDWVQTLLDAAGPFAGEVAVLAVENTTLRLRGQMPADQLPAELAFPIAAAAAFQSSIGSKDVVTSLRTPGEVSAALSEGHAGERAHLFPIINSDRVSAVLFASDSNADLNALELVAGIAASVLGRKANLALHSQITTVPVPVPNEVKLPAWTELPADQRQLHIRAQRFARVTLAEIQLARPEACRAGRDQGDLYLFLKREIDRARENYRKQFMTVPSMVDYLHLELIQNAAEGDEQKMGADYPGSLQ